jgi:hypothetical protein
VFWLVLYRAVGYWVSMSACLTMFAAPLTCPDQVRDELLLRLPRVRVESRTSWIFVELNAFT